MLKVDLTKAKKLDKRGYAWLKSYAVSKYARLDDCCTSYSTSKQVAYNANINLMCDLGGQDFKILSYNCNFFTVAFVVDSASSNSFYFVVSTAYSVYVYDVDVYDLFKFLQKDGLADSECGGGCVCSDTLINKHSKLFGLIFDKFKGFLRAYGLRDSKDNTEYSYISTYSDCVDYARLMGLDNYAIDSVVILDSRGNVDYDGSIY